MTRSATGRRYEEPVRRRAFWLEYLTVCWNFVEGAGSLTAAVLANSVALFAFGLDSGVEVFASAVVIWELHGASRRRERRALRLIGASYLAVAVYIIADAIRSLVGGRHPNASPAGVILMVITVVVMLALGFAKRATGRRMGSATVLADATFTFVDAALSATVLVGLILNARLGWWWADPAMALVVSGIAVREGFESLHGEAHAPD